VDTPLPLDVHQVSRNSRFLRWLPLVVLLATLGGSLYVWNILESGIRQRARTVYQDKTAAITAQIADRLRDQERVLLGGGGLFNSQGEVSRKQWCRYAAALRLDQNLPGVLGVGYSAWLTPGEKEAMERRVRAEGFPQFEVKPPGARGMYTSIIYLEPFNWRNQRAFGYDMFSEPVRRAAMNDAVNQGCTCISGKITLVQETEQEKQSGLLMYLPVYKKGLPIASSQERWAALRGFVYSPIRMNDFVNGTLGKFPDDIAFDIYDGSSARPGNRMFSSLKGVGGTVDGQGQPDLSSFSRVEEYGRTWTIHFRSLPSFRREFNRISSLIVLIGGLLVSLLSAFVTSTLLATREKALKIARAMVSELQLSEEKVSLILNSTAEAIIGIDTLGRCTFCNAASLRLLRYAVPGELLGKSMHSQIHHSGKDGTPRLVEECQIHRAISSGVEGHGDHEVFWRADGSSFIAEYWTYPQRKGGEVVGAVVTFIDVTDRKLMELELQLQSKLLEVEIADRQRAQEELGHHAFKLEQLNRTLEARVESALATNRRKDRKMIQQDKLASIGQLAAGVAHEINNPIGFVSSNLRTLDQYFDHLQRHYRFVEGIADRELPPAFREAIAADYSSLDIEEIWADVGDLIRESLEGATRVANIVTNLKGFSRLDAQERELVELGNCLESALSIAYNELKYVATITRQYQQLPQVLCHPGQLNQVFMNLLVNAGQAITPPGEIVLCTWFDDGYVYASVSDTGQGIPWSIRERIFEPFFTTKEVGKGTGLGLSISYDIIKVHQGELSVESTEGSGSTFTVKLPRQHDTAEPEPGQLHPQEPVSAPDGTGRSEELTA